MTPLCYNAVSMIVIKEFFNMKKRKIIYLAAASLMAMSLAACTNNQQNSSSSSNQAKSSKVVSKKTNKTSSANNANSKSSQSSSNESKKPSSQAPEERFRRLTGQLRSTLPGMKLPTQSGLGQGLAKINVRYTKTANKNIVYYSVGSSAQQFNANKVKKEKPYAVLTEYKKGNAASLINYTPAQKGLPTKQLDSTTKATLQGAAGSEYLQWNKGRYSFVIRASKIRKQDPMNKGKQVLALSKRYALPATTSHGSLQVQVGDSFGSLNTVIAWQDGKNIYQIKAHDTETAFKMLASLK